MSEILNTPTNLNAGLTNRGQWTTTDIATPYTLRVQLISLKYATVSLMRSWRGNDLDYTILMRYYAEAGRIEREIKKIQLTLEQL